MQLSSSILFIIWMHYMKADCIYHQMRIIWIGFMNFLMNGSLTLIGLRKYWILVDVHWWLLIIGGLFLIHINKIYYRIVHFRIYWLVSISHLHSLMESIRSKENRDWKMLVKELIIFLLRRYCNRSISDSMILMIPSV